MTRGETAVKQPQPTPRIDRVDETKEQNAPGEAKRQVNTDNTPKPQEATAREERKEVTAALPPPLPLPVPRPPPPKAPEPPKVAAVAKPPKAADAPEQEEDAEEIIRQAAKKREEQKKLDDARRADEAKKREDARKAEEARKLDDQRKADEVKRQEAAREEQRREQQEEARKRDELKKIADAKAADDRKKAEDAKKAQEAAKKAADEKKKREAEQEAKNQATADAARRALLASREAPANSGNTGPQVQRTPAAGAPAATGQRMNPSDRAALAGLLADQIRSCWSIPVSGKPNVLPQVRVSLNADGSLGGTPTLINASTDPNFRALAESGMRAIRQCAPFRIPQRFSPTYDDWRTISVQLNPDD
jgi:colicin import membrane protein